MRKESFILLGNTITIALQESRTASKDYVVTERFRPDQLKTSASDTSIESSTLESEFVSDIQFQINRINQKGQFNADAVVSAIKDGCRNHINRCGRLITTDLYTYVDCGMHIISSVYEISQEDSSKIYTQYVNSIIGEFVDFIYVAKPPYGLVKLTDIMKK